MFRKHRFPDGVFCPHCQSKKIRILNYQNCKNLSGKRFYFCNGCLSRFNDHTGTPFERFRIDLKKILLAVSLHTVNDCNSRELRQNLNICKCTALKLLSVFRELEKLDEPVFNNSIVEIDDSAHWKDPVKMVELKKKLKQNPDLKGWHYTEGRHVILTIHDRIKKRSVLKLIPDIQADSIEKHFLKIVKAENLFLSDCGKPYKKIFKRHRLNFARVDHSREYAREEKSEWKGQKITVHTNGAEMTFKHFKCHFRQKYRRTPRPEPFLTDFSFKFCRDRKKLFDFFLNLCG